MPNPTQYKSVISLFPAPCTEAPATVGSAVGMWETLPALSAMPLKANPAIVKDEREASAIIQTAMRDAELIRRQAIADAGTLLSQAREQAESMRSDALVEGYSNGLMRAHEEVEAEFSAKFELRTAVLTQSVDELIEAICDERKQLWNAMEHEIVDLSLDIARKVIKVEVTQNSPVIEAVIGDALRRVTDRTSVRILVNPDELQHARSCREDFMIAMDGVRNLEIDADRRIGRGGCTIETNAGSIDAKIDTQFEQVVQAMKQ